MATLVALKVGINSPAFGVSISLAFIVILDASSLRRQVGKDAVAINKLNAVEGGSPLYMRERMGHTRIEILAGIITGAAVAILVNCL